MGLGDWETTPWSWYLTTITMKAAYEKSWLIFSSTFSGSAFLLVPGNQSNSNTKRVYNEPKNISSAVLQPRNLSWTRMGTHMPGSLLGCQKSCNGVCPMASFFSFYIWPASPTFRSLSCICRDSQRLSAVSYRRSETAQNCLVTYLAKENPWCRIFTSKPRITARSSSKDSGVPGFAGWSAPSSLPLLH